MPKHSKPRDGSLQFWPRKRAKRIYPSVSFIGNRVPVFAGWKAGMTHIQTVDNKKKSKTFGRTITKSATILETPPLLVCALRFYKKNASSGFFVSGEQWIKIPKFMKRKVPTQPSVKNYDGIFDHVRIVVVTQPSKSNMKKIKPEIFEIPYDSEKAKTMLGKEIDISEVFKDGEFVDVTSITKGHGFTGPVKRFGIKIQGRKDAQHHRHAGSLGGVVPRHIDWRVPLPGQHGFHRRTELNKNIIKIGKNPKDVNPSGGFINYGIVKSSYVLLDGSIPGHKKRLVLMRKAVRKSYPSLQDLKYVSLESQHGR